MIDRGRGRVTTWRPDARRQAGDLPWRLGGIWQSARGHLNRWLVAEAAPGRLFPWLPIAFGFGIVVYFSAEREPAWWAGLSLVAALAILAFLAHARPIAFPVLVGAGAAAAGFSAATLKSLAISHPVLAAPIYSAQLTGYIEAREERERSDRIVLCVHSMNAGRPMATLERVRLAVRKGTAPAVGAFVELRARLNPPLAPLRPGGYDFARDLYFQGIGASGFALGQIRVAAPQGVPDLRLRYAAAIGGLRDDIDARIRAILPGDKGAIASALITGKRDAISTPVSEAMYVSSLGHVLSISGYHMAVVAGVMFFTVRALLALMPALASRYPIKKWAALAALAMAAFYLILSGAAVATQRAFIMTAIVLIGVMCDRPAMTLRTIAVAALAVLIIAPESIVHPSFQMSFAATLALIAAYERGLPWMSRGPGSSVAARIALWGGREILGLIVVSLVAGVATTLYAAYHFHRVAPYGLLSNLLAMPLVSLWIMPSGLLALFTLPLGLDGALWRLMGGGIEWMIDIAVWVANLPGAVGRVRAFDTGPLLLASLGFVIVCLLRSPLRWSGLMPVALAGLVFACAPVPDVLVSHDARMVAVRNPEGRLSVMTTARDNFTVREWLAADADPRGPADDSLSKYVHCDDAGCTVALPSGEAISLSTSAESLLEDCQRVKLIVTARTVPPQCQALVIDREASRRYGAVSLTQKGDSFAVNVARAPAYDRPWAKSPQFPASSTLLTPTSSPRQTIRDATPRGEDLDVGDQ